jgi:hypothetical protein
LRILLAFLLTIIIANFAQALLKDFPDKLYWKANGETIDSHNISYTLKDEPDYKAVTVTLSGDPKNGDGDFQEEYSATFRRDKDNKIVYEASIEDLDGERAKIFNNYAEQQEFFNRLYEYALKQRQKEKSRESK